MNEKGRVRIITLIILLIPIFKDVQYDCNNFMFILRIYFTMVQVRQYCHR